MISCVVPTWEEILFTSSFFLILKGLMSIYLLLIFIIQGIQVLNNVLNQVWNNHLLRKLLVLQQGASEKVWPLSVPLCLGKNKWQESGTWLRIFTWSYQPCLHDHPLQYQTSESLIWTGTNLMEWCQFWPCWATLETSGSLNKEVEGWAVWDITGSPKSFAL